MSQPAAELQLPAAAVFVGTEQLLTLAQLRCWFAASSTTCCSASTR